MIDPKRHVRFAQRFASAASLGLLVAASCAAPIDGREEDPEEVLTVQSGPKGTGLRDLGFASWQMGAQGTPDFLSGRIPAGVRDGNDLRALLTGTLRDTFRLAAETDFEIRSERTDAQGYRYIKLRQLHGKVPVVRGEIVAQLDDEGAVLALVGRLVPDLQMQGGSTLAGDAAIQGALSGLARGSATVHERPVLQIFTDERGGSVLTWRAVVEYLGQAGRALETLYVDARSGEIVAQHSRIHTALSRTIYDMKQKCLQTGSELPGTLLFNEGGTTSDTIARDVYNNTGNTYWFYKNYLGRDSYDNMGAQLKSSAHTTFSGGISCSGDNAAWLGSPYNQMVYGDGDGTTFKPLTSLDVSAHELTHAVTNLTSDLTYQNESGALNEAMSDIMGATAEAWVQSGGSSAGNPPAINASANTWKIGEEVAGPGLMGGALRFMNNPTADAYSKDYYPERITGSSDSGGVHGNSGIANLAYYLLSQGGTHPRSKTTTVVTAIGIGKAAKIFFTANTTLFSASTNFQGARSSTAQAAQNLYGACSPEWVNTHKAWDAVGVPGTWTPCGAGDSTPPSVNLTAPTGGTVSGSLTLSANASDNVGVTSVEFYRGTTLIAADTSAPYAVTWDTTSVTNGSYALTAKAKDAAGNVGTSAAVNVTVNNMGTGGGSNESEPNNSFAQANRVTTSGTQMTGFISSSSDVDYFRMELAAGKTLTATLTPPAGSDFDLYIYNSNFTLIGRSEKGAGLVDQTSVTNTGTSTFTRYIVVRYYSGASNTNSYKLKLSW